MKGKREKEGGVYLGLFSPSLFLAILNDVHHPSNFIIINSS